ncbi:MAG: glycosyltransferase, partial [Solirubrobacteraceae bacterium]
MPATLSVCIPTHGRRAEVLRVAMLSVLDQLEPELHDRVEICVSDNASSDGTAEMVSELAERSPVPVSYSRNAADIGLAGNMMRVVELAAGDFCWLLGSDDEMVDGGLRHVIGLIERFPDASGYCVSWANFGADLHDRGEPDAAPYRPPPLTTRAYRGMHDVIDGVGLMWGYISTNVVHRERWLAAAASVGDRAKDHPTWPQLRIMGEMARRDPVWVYSPHVVVRNRTFSGWMYELGRVPRDHAKMHIDLVDGIDAVLAELIGKGTPLHRELMTRMYWMVASGRVVTQIKRIQRGDWRREVELARSVARAFWWLPDFWTGAGPR